MLVVIMPQSCLYLLLRESLRKVAVNLKIPLTKNLPTDSGRPQIRTKESLLEEEDNSGELGSRAQSANPKVALFTVELRFVRVVDNQP
jgi:hypothetical protein